MNTPTSELIVRAAALYVPITIATACVIHRRPHRRQVAGALVAFVWNLVGLLVLNVLAQQFGWWSFSTDVAVVAGTPVDLWLGWALLWGAVPLLAASERLVAVAVGLVVADLFLMPMAAPIVSLQSTWLVGEVLCVATCLVPGLLLGHWTETDVHVRRRATLQVVAFTGLLLYVLPTLIFTETDENWATLVHRQRWQFLLAALVAAPAGSMALQAVREFAVVGQGTPVPLDPPSRLVVTGPYAYVANPMQLGASLILALWGLLLGSPAVVAAAGMAVLFSAGIAMWTERGELSDRFGSDWTHYRSGVRLWLPSWRPSGEPAATVFVASTCEPCSEVGRFFVRRYPHGLVVAAAEASPDDLTRITYRSGDDISEVGLAAIGRSVEHINLAWAVASWIVRLPLLRPILQLVADAVGAGPRPMARA